MIRRKSRMFKYKSSQKNYYLFRDLLSHGQYLICYLIGKNLLEYVILRLEIYLYLTSKRRRAQILNFGTNLMNC